MSKIELGTKNEKKSSPWKLPVANVAAIVFVGLAAAGAFKLSSNLDAQAASRVEQVSSDLLRKNFRSLNDPVSMRIPASWQASVEEIDGKKTDILTGWTNRIVLKVVINSRSFPEWVSMEDAVNNIAGVIKAKSGGASVKVLSEKEVESDPEIEAFKKLGIAGQKASLIHVKNATEREGYLYGLPLMEEIIAVFQDPTSGKVITVTGGWRATVGNSSTIDQLFHFRGARVPTRERDVALNQLKEVFESAQVLLPQKPVITP